MRRLQLTAFGAIVPHAPLLLPEVAGPKHAAVTRPVADAVRALPVAGVDLMVLVSPHGRTTGVYRIARGSLDGFGPRGITIDAPARKGAAEALAAAWGRPVTDVPGDHGIVVPARLIGPKGTPVVALAFEEGAPVQETLEDARGAADAIDSLGERVALIASAHLSAGLTERAPLSLQDGAAGIDAAVVEALQLDPGGVIDLLEDLASIGGSCGAGPLAVFSLLCRGTAATIHSYEHPFGVGYVVASAGR